MWSVLSQQQPKRTMSVMKGLKAMTEMVEMVEMDDMAFGRHTERNVAQAIDWIKRIDAYDHGDLVPSSATKSAEADCIGDT